MPMSLSLDLGLGARAGGGTVAAPTAPSITWTSDAFTPNAAIDITGAFTFGGGDVVELQRQVHGADWSSPTSDTTHTVTSSEIAGTLIDLVLSGLGDGAWDIRARFKYAGGAYSAWSNIVTKTLTVSPINTAAPVVSGTATAGSTLSVTNGTWTGAPTITYAYQWRRDGTNLGGATSSTYTVVTGDQGHSVDCVVKATNTYGGPISQASSNSISIPAGGISYSYVSPINNAVAFGTGGQTTTFNPSFSCGASDLVVAEVFSDGRRISSATIGGFTPTTVVQAIPTTDGGAASQDAAIFTLTGHALTNPAIVVNADTNRFNNVTLVIYVVSNANPTATSTAKKTFSYVADPQVTSSALTVPTGGIALGGYYHQSTPGTFAWNNMSLDSTLAVSSTLTCSYAHSTSAGSLTPSCTSGGFTGSVMVAATWGQ